jgi:hypothetical protein
MLTYALCGFFLFPILMFFITAQLPANRFWQSILIRISGPALIYLGLVLQRTRKPVPIRRKIIGVIIFLIGFGWFFSVLEKMLNS